MKATTVRELPIKSITGRSGVSAMRSFKTSRRTSYSRSYHCGQRISISPTATTDAKRNAPMAVAASVRADRRRGGSADNAKVSSWRWGVKTESR